MGKTYKKNKPRPNHYRWIGKYIEDRDKQDNTDLKCFLRRLVINSIRRGVIAPDLNGEQEHDNKVLSNVFTNPVMSKCIKAALNKELHGASEITACKCFARYGALTAYIEETFDIHISKRKAGLKTKPQKCPYCGKTLTQDVIPGTNRTIMRCKRCNKSSTAYPYTNIPMGPLVTPDVGAVHVLVHKYFDRYWTNDHERKQCYLLLARALNCPEAEAHIANYTTREECFDALRIIKSWGNPEQFRSSICSDKESGEDEILQRICNA